MVTCIHLTSTYILLLFGQSLPLVTDKSQESLVVHVWMLFLVCSANVILEQNVCRGRTLGCIGVLDFLFTLLLYGSSIITDVERDELALTRRFRDCRVEKLGEIVNSGLIDGHFGDSLGKYV